MKEITYNEYAKETLDILAKGAFLTTTANGEINTMTIGWGAIGYQWGRPVLTVMVRQSRYTKDLIDAADEFTVSFPPAGMEEAVRICGTKSGRDTDKLAEAGLTLIPAKKLTTPFIGGCDLHFECKTIYRQDMEDACIDPAVRDRWYPNGDLHTIYCGEILGAYRA